MDKAVAKTACCGVDQTGKTMGVARAVLPGTAACASDRAFEDRSAEAA